MTKLKRDGQFCDQSLKLLDKIATTREFASYEVHNLQACKLLYHQEQEESGEEIGVQEIL